MLHLKKVMVLFCGLNFTPAVYHYWSPWQFFNIFPQLTCKFIFTKSSQHWLVLHSTGNALLFYLQNQCKQFTLRGKIKYPSLLLVINPENTFWHWPCKPYTTNFIKHLIRVWCCLSSTRYLHAKCSALALEMIGNHFASSYHAAVEQVSSTFANCWIFACQMLSTAWQGIANH